MPGLDPNIAARLKQAAGQGGATEEAREIAPHLEEFRGRWKGTTPLMLRPKTTEEVVRILSVCNETRTAIVPQGGNTGLVGGQIPTKGEVLLSLERMNRIRSVSAEDNALVAEAGVVLADVQRAADAAGRLFPLSLGAEGSCMIGGNLSTNAGGVGVLRYGMSRELVLGLEVVLADGRVLDLMRGLRKDNTGYDLKQLFIGAEGTLGVITAAMLKLFPKPAGHATVLAAIPGLNGAVDLLNRLQDATGGLVTAFEIMPEAGLELVLKHIPGTANPLPHHRGWTVLIEVSNPAAFDATQVLTDALGRAMADGLVSDAAFAKNARERAALWRLREAIPEARRKVGPSLANDISVRPSQIPGFIAAAEEAIARELPGAVSFAFGHVGDGNLHLAVHAPPGRDADLIAARERIEQAVNEELRKFGGSISAEHGLGLAKNDANALYKSAAEIDVMRALKRALDPANILNPGKVLPTKG
jgi:FAD/FMN-containing dehydrogenase